ncbi:MAG: hypothetical protein EOO11_13100 [Chitinophagaceae bacterium]|nr:MAG: hypothetical protein EOO11_13100 [Chitinophagaceae bacterium]
MARTTIHTPFWTVRRIRIVSLAYWLLLLGVLWYLPWAEGRRYRAQCARVPGVVLAPPGLPSELAVQLSVLLPQEVGYAVGADSSFLQLKDGSLPVGTPLTVLVPRAGSAFVEGTDSWWDYAGFDLLLLPLFGAALFRVFRISVRSDRGRGRVLLPGAGDRYHETIYPKGYFDD